MTTHMVQIRNRSESTTMVPSMQKQESSGDEIFQMQMELSELRKRIKILDGGTERCDLLDLLKERDVELKGKNEQLQILNEKFHQITSGLSQIETERQSLRESISSLESEKKKVQRHLNIREKEVMSLVRRCAEQEEKLQETVNLRVSHRSLEEENNEMKDHVAQLKEELATIDSVRKELFECELARTEALERVKQLEVQNRETSDGLVEIISKLQKSQSDSDTKMSQLEADMEKLREDREKDRKESTRTVRELREELSQREERVKQLQQHLQESGGIISALRSEKASMRESNELAISDLKAEHSKQIMELRLKNREHHQTVRDEHRAVVAKLKSEIGERDISISELREVKVRQEELIYDAQNQLEKEKNEHEQCRETLSKNIEGLEQETSILSDSLKGKDVEIERLKAELSAALKSKEDLQTAQDKFSLELSELLGDKLRLQGQLEESANQLNEMQSALSQTQEINTTLTSEKDNLEISIAELEQNLLVAMEFEQHLDVANKTILELQERSETAEKENIDAVSKLEADKQALLESKVAIEKDLGNRLRETQEENAEREKDLKNQLFECRKLADTLVSDNVSQNRALEMLGSEFAAFKVKSEKETRAAEEEVQILKVKIKKSSDTIEDRDGQIEQLQGVLRKELQSKEEEIQCLKDQITNSHAQNMKNEKEFESKYRALHHELDTRNSAVDKLNACLDEAKKNSVQSESEVSALKANLEQAKTMVLKHESKILELNNKISFAEMEAAEIVADLESQISQKNKECDSLEQDKVALKEQSENDTARFESELLKAQSEKEQALTELQCQLEILEERNSLIISLEKRRSEQGDKIKSLRAELDLLIVAEAKSKKEHASVIIELEDTIEREKSRADVMENDMVTLSKERDAAEAKLAANAAASNKIQLMLNDRTKLLGDMVKQNKELECDLQEARTIASDLQEESDRYLQEKGVLEMALANLQKDVDKKEEHFLTAMHKERQLRDKVERDLCLAEQALQNAKKDGKEYEELEKENGILKDKVRRQEAYLKRKLEKEKMLKDRMLTSSNKPNVVPRLASPMRKRIPSPMRKRIPAPDNRPSSRTRGVTDSMPEPRPIPRPVSENRPSSRTRHVIESVPSFPDELDEILDDEL